LGKTSDARVNEEKIENDTINEKISSLMHHTDSCEEFSQPTRVGALMITRTL